MNTVRLADILETCILNYIQKEYSKKWGIFALIVSFIFGQKAHLRMKAENYFEDIKNLSHYSNDWIFFYVADDLSTMNSVLAANKQLRISFLEGLCRYLYVSDAEIMTTAFTLNGMNSKNLNDLR